MPTSNIKFPIMETIGKLDFHFDCKNWIFCFFFLFSLVSCYCYYYIILWEVIIFADCTFFMLLFLFLNGSLCFYMTHCHSPLCHLSLFYGSIYGLLTWWIIQDEDFVADKDDEGSPTDDSGEDDSDANDSGDEKEVSYFL